MGTWMVIFAVSGYLDDGGLGKNFLGGVLKTGGCA